MAVTANSIITPQSSVSATAVLTAAEVTFNAPTAVVDLVTAAQNTNGARLTRLFAIPRAAIATANNIQLYEKVGATYTLIDSALMATVTPAAAVANPKTDFGYSESNPLIVKAGVGLAVAMGQAVANGVVVKAEGGLY
jgi:hypothetical protein